LQRGGSNDGLISSIMKILGSIFGIALGLLLVINGGFMLASPRAWFKLPAWIASWGSQTPQKYSSGWGAVQVRLAGAVFLGVVIWVIWGMFSSR
jgi:hypothetical protein